MRSTISQTSVMRQERPRFSPGSLTLGGLALLSAVPVAFLIHLINESFPQQAERAVLVVGGLFAIFLVLPPTVYLLIQRRSVVPAKLGLILLATVSVLLVANYLYSASFYVLFPADVLIWSESDFVNDILKFRTGYPIYTAQANNESFTYVPGAQLLTYLLAWLLGNAASIPLYRMIQVGYTVLAAAAAFCACRRLVEMSLPARSLQHVKTWGALWLPIFFLIATNQLTNPFVNQLHNDALAQLLTVTAYWLLLEYVSTRSRRVLVLMAIVPAVGFLVKQSLAIWALLYCAQLIFFDEAHSVKRVVTFALISFGGIAVAVASCYLLWGEHFTYWTFTVLGKHGVSPLRSFKHILDVWPYFAIGLLGGWVLVRRGSKFNLLIGPWLIWLALILLGAYTSGIAWMLNHIGPGCLIASVWFLAALVRIWPQSFRVTTGKLRAEAWLRVGISIALVCLLFSGLGVINIPVRPVPEDAHRYIREIEREFAGQAPENILLDVGSWVYLKSGVVMKDRAPSIGERGYSETGDFSGIIERLEQKRYQKILVRNLHSPDFWYDHVSWRKSSEIKRALLENYHETGKIMEVAGQETWKRPYGFSEISILAPKSN